MCRACSRRWIIKKDYGVRKASTLYKLGWKPGNDENGARYWIVRHEWDKCVAIGAPAAEPLSEALKDSEWPVRQAAAEALVNIYHARELDEQTK
jgi:HEAT repeat protein